VRFPRKAVMIAFLQACGVHGDMESWRRTWERVASEEEGSGRPEVTQAALRRHRRAAASEQHPWQVTRDAERETQAQRADRDHVLAENVASADPVGMDHAASGQEAPSPLARRSMWHFPDGSGITLVCYRMRSADRPPSANPSNPNYVRVADLADLDTVMDIYGAIRAYNPTSRVVIMAAQDLTQRDVESHLVLIGGLTWRAVTPWFSRIFPIPVEAWDSFEHGAILVHDPDGGEHEFKCTLIDGDLVEDIGLFAFGKNPSAPRQTLTICGGITTRGVHGAARCFINWEMRERNEQYIMRRFPDGSTYCIVMKVPVANNDPLAPDLSRSENRLFEWCDSGIGNE
jgi:hypothetical protein